MEDMDIQGHFSFYQVTDTCRGCKEHHSSHYKSKMMGIVMLREENLKEDYNIMKEERDHLGRQLFYAHNFLKNFNSKLRELTENYAAIAPVIEMKNRLAEEVQRLQQQHSQREETHSKELESLREEMTEVKREAEKKVEEAVQKEQDKAKAAAAAAAEALKEREEQLATVKLDLADVREKQLQVLRELRVKHHDEMEKLRGRLSRMQQSLSSRATSDMDLVANKLQATRAEYQEQLRERQARVTQLEEELQQARDTLRHHQLLSVVRGVATSAPAATPTPTPTPASSPLHITFCAVDDIAGKSEEGGDLNGECSSEHGAGVSSGRAGVSSSEAGVSSSVTRRPAHNRTKPVPRAHNTCPPIKSNTLTKLGNKRKLYSGKSFLQEEQDELLQP
nr:interaptin-like isoform X3 [Cherax quadricarinatus]